MAAGCGRRTLRFFGASAEAIFRSPSSCSSSLTSPASKLAGITPPKPTAASRFALRKLTSSRLPVELGGMLSLVPLHSATASALFTSLLSLHNQSWGCLSEGFATPL
ncbi:hypothetical protein SLEP1_g32688 [Rubroshorea leprosula]|uniref:Protein NUCLEAR FUSION DEFECTIVE 6, chloroplastic/mitochondrial-like n=1 Tax=Rubroshorea leprosula TaxID=152421 RepID=A0AAV5KE44_9ROSI|nr:hypothetical protein SLEP1_g32687 [Rubroshorea leprosula]GKV22871.1 hypothetical protein SLEP1_g32688 [Rubroshorea leprosula]